MSLGIDDTSDYMNLNKPLKTATSMLVLQYNKIMHTSNNM